MKCQPVLLRCRKTNLLQEPESAGQAKFSQKIIRVRLIRPLRMHSPPGVKLHTLRPHPRQADPSLIASNGLDLYTDALLMIFLGGVFSLQYQ
jgi:hypothetical protein